MKLIKVKFENPEYKLGLTRKLVRLGVDVNKKFQQEYKNGIKTGRYYGTHRASAPEETPARITGNLGRSFQRKASKNYLDLIDNSGYGAFLEFGTRRMKARRGVYQALEKSLRKFEAELLELDT